MRFYLCWPPHLGPAQKTVPGQRDADLGGNARGHRPARPPIKPPSSAAGLSGRVVTWAAGLLLPLQMSSALFKYLSNHLLSPWCWRDAQVTWFWRPKPFLDDTSADGGRVGPSGLPEGLSCQRNGKSFCDPPRRNPPPSSDDWQRLWVKCHTGSLAKASQSPE